MVQLQRIRGHIFAVFQNLGTLALLAIAFPVSFSVVFASLLWSYFRGLFQKKVEPSENPKNILLTGGKMTKALLLARSFHATGHKVFLVETKNYWMAGNQFSNSVERFYTVPAPQHDPDGYTQALLDIVKKENIDMFIPVSTAVASVYDSLASPVLSSYCGVFHFDADITKMLDDKLAFCEKARSLGLPAPKSFPITDPEQLLKFDFEGDGSQYILKSVAYNSVQRLALVKLPCSTEKMAAYVHSLPISKDNPWIMQEFITGQEYCTHSTVRDGVLMLHCCSKSSAFQVNYEDVENPQILEWVTHFVKELNLTGQISFDFIEQEDGTVYPIECNPRVHSAITMFHDQPKVVADAYLSDSSQAPKPTLQPRPDSKPTYWLFHELWRFTNVRSWHDLQERLKIISRGTEAIFSVSDPLPFLMVHHWQIPLLLLNSLRGLKGWVRIDFNIGKLVQLESD